MAAKYDVGDTVQISGKVTEIVMNEEIGVRYRVKMKANDKSAYLDFEEDEINDES